MRQPIFRFRNFQLDPASRQLWRDGVRVPLPLKSFECLAYLIEHRDRAVGRDELIAAVWGRAEVGDTLLGQTMLRARRAIGDGAGEHTAIRTVTRFGYQWVMPVEVGNELEIAESDAAAAGDLAEAPTAAAEEAAVPATPVEPSFRSWRRPTMFAIGVVLLALVTLAVVRHWYPKPGAALHVASGNLVLVLPVSGVQSGEDSWIRLGAMDYLASRIRGAKGLQVLPSEQTVALLGRDAGVSDQRGAEDLYRFEQATGAAYILAPRITHVGSSWNLALDVYHDRGIQTFEAQAGSALEATAQATNRFLESIGLPAAVSAAESPSTPTEYLQRIDASMLAGDLAQARSLADAAPKDLKGDPAFTVRASRIAFRSGEIDKAEQMLRPLDRDDPLLSPTIRANALLGLGAIAIYRQDLAAAERYYTKTIAVIGEHGDPTILGKAYMERGAVNGAGKHVDAATSDFAQARVELERAGDRLGTGNLDTNLGLFETFRNRYAEAEAAYDRAIAVYTRFGVADNLAIALQGKTYVQRALLELDGALASSERQAALADHVKNPLLRRRIAMSRAPVLLATGHLKQAAEAIDPYAPTDPAKAADDPAFAVLRARLLIEQGGAADALRDADSVIDAIEQQPNPSSEVYLSEAVDVFVRAALLDRQIERAAGFVQRLQASKDVALDDARPFIVELDLARVLAAKGDDAAVPHFAKAVSMAESSSPEDVVTANAAYADYLRNHPSDETMAVLGRLVPYADRDYRAARAVAQLYAALGDTARADQAGAQAHRLAGERAVEQPRSR